LNAACTNIQKFAQKIGRVAALKNARDSSKYVKKLPWQAYKKKDLQVKKVSAPQVESNFQRTVGRVKWGLVIGLVVLFLILGGIQLQWWDSLWHAWPARLFSSF
jgi:hypothetical protein